ncbi:hypothetical protein BKA81DRAFT_350919 [Phyllosticta paracitricarpa]
MDLSGQRARVGRGGLELLRRWTLTWAVGVIVAPASCRLGRVVGWRDPCRGKGSGRVEAETSERDETAAAMHHCYRRPARLQHVSQAGVMGEARQGEARHGTARQGRTGQDRTGQ